MLSESGVLLFLVFPGDPSLCPGKIKGDEKLWRDKTVKICKLTRKSGEGQTIYYIII